MPKQKDKHKVDRIYKAALQLVLKTGYAGLKISDVAKEAGVATGTIYTYFEDKRALINGLFIALKQSKMKEIFDQYDENLPFYEGFKVLWHNYLKVGLKEPERNMFIEQYQRSDYLDEQAKALTSSAYKPFYEVLEKAKEAQIIKDIPVEVMGAQLIGSANEIAKLYFRKKEAITQEVIDSCFEMAWHSIRK